MKREPRRRNRRHSPLFLDLYTYNSEYIAYSLLFTRKNKRKTNLFQIHTYLNDLLLFYFLIRQHLTVRIGILDQTCPIQCISATTNETKKSLQNRVSFSFHQRVLIIPVVFRFIVGFLFSSHFSFLSLFFSFLSFLPHSFSSPSLYPFLNPQSIPPSFYRKNDH